MHMYKSSKTRNIIMKLMYDGTNYNGWQRLRNKNDGSVTIQGLLEETLSALLNEAIQVIGSGRTDAGVHALQQVCNFHTLSGWTTKELRKELNARLPMDIRVLTLEEGLQNFHARYDAVSKVYEYRIDIRERESVFTRKYAYPNQKDLNLDDMKKAAHFLIGKHDFKAFSTDRRDLKSTVRTIQDINIYRVHDRDKAEVRIECKGDGFLHHMIRIIAGTLVEVGNGSRAIESVQIALTSRKRCNAGTLLYPQGLFLKQVNYEPLIRV